MAMRCDAKILAMRLFAAEILCDVLPQCKNTSDAMPRYQPLKSTIVTGTQIEGSLVVVWNGWGYGIAIFRALNFHISEPEIWQKSLLLRNFRGNFRDFPANKIRPLKNIVRTLENGHSIRDPIHTPTKRRPMAKVPTFLGTPPFL